MLCSQLSHRHTENLAQIASPRTFIRMVPVSVLDYETQYLERVFLWFS
jgi:hypothetical protein